jgi:hypothetical protein
MEFINPGDLPPELREAIESQVAQAEMGMDSTLHEIYSMFDEIEIDYLEIIRRLLHNCAGEPQASGFWEGIILSKIAQRRKVCPACGKDHEKQAQEMLEAERARLAEEGGDLGSRAAVLIQMDQYHVAPVDDGDLLGSVVCTGITPPVEGCGIVYQSLEDRMLRAPDYCSGCFAKAGQG